MTFALDRQIASQPAAVRAVLAAPSGVALDASRPIAFTGIGTSLHAARIAAGWVTQLTGGRTCARAIDAHDLALLEPVTPDQQVVVMSHRGSKRYPGAALAKARAAGAATVAVVGAAAPEPDAGTVVRTCENEVAGTFTVSYLAALAALARLVERLDQTGAFAKALDEVPAALAATLAEPAPVDLAARVAEREPLMVVGFGGDHVTAAEAALKIKEGAWLWAEGLSLEFALHGTPAAYRPGQAAIVIVPEADDGGRTQTLRELLETIGVEVATCGAGGDADMAFAPTHPLLRPFVGVVPFQRLTAELARVRGTDPDTLHGDRGPWRAAMTSLTL